ncbi:alpha-2-macroglobulin family protein, partial [candidate division KSB1 bacterium]|nr:alpha-2-macroglobulin family protein [candidate division KSB1 bacterium]
LHLKGDFRPGQSYNVTIKKNLPANNLSVLETEFSQQVNIENLPPSIKFTETGIYLPRKGNRLLGVETVNVEKIQVEISKIYPNNLVHFLNITSGYYYDFEYTPGAQYLGKKLQREEIAITSETNEPLITAIDLGKFVEQKHQGVFRIVVRDATYRWRMDDKWVMATDMGLLAHKGESEVIAWVNSISSLNPYADVEVTLMSYTNQVIATGTTNSSGMVVFSNLKNLLKEFEPLALIARKGDDLTYLKFPDCQLATSDFDVDGRPYLLDGFEAYLYSERGVYRPGENVNIAAIVRGKELSMPGSFPVKLEVLGPDNRIFEEFRGSLSGGGACEFQLAIPAYAQTGSYLARLMVTDDQEIGRVKFNVEEFVPDRIKVSVIPEKQSCRTGETTIIDVKAVNLFGPPAAGRKAEAECEIKAVSFASPKYKSYTFGDSRREFDKMQVKLGETTLDSTGTCQFQLVIPDQIRPPSALRGVIMATVSEPGGRAVSAYETIDIHPYPLYLGLRRDAEGYAEPGKKALFHYVVLDNSGNEIDLQRLNVSVFKVVWHSILKQDNLGHYRYVSESTNEQIESFSIPNASSKGQFSFQPQEYGEYLVILTHPDSDMRTSLSFYASGWGFAPWAMTHPERIELEFDQKLYKPGSTARVLVKAPFAGKLILCVEREKMLFHKMMDMKENTATIEIPVESAYKPNVYVTATLIRSISSLEKHAPVRAFGTAPLRVDCSANFIRLALNAPTEVRPKKNLEIEIEAIDPVTDAYVTIAAVDEGICQLTEFKSPNPFDYFYAKKQLQTNTYDIYNEILPELETSSINSHAAGGRFAGVRKKHLTPVDAKRVKPVSLWSGMVHLGANRKRKVSFSIPEFNGSLRLMAVAFDGSNFGAGTRNITVRGPIVLTPTFPRFLAGNDLFLIPVSVFNGTGSSASFTVSLSAEGPVDILSKPEASLNLKNNSEDIVYFKAKAKRGMGKIKFKVLAKGGGEATESEVEIPLRPPVPPVTLTGSGIITVDKSAALKLPSDWIPGTQEYQLTLSAFPTVRFAGSLQYLLQYPYGCIEQTTSRCFPLLYFADLAKLSEPGMFRGNTPDYYVEEGIQKIQTMQLPSGGFSYWHNSADESKWGSIYASHFLVEARKAGYAVSPRVYAHFIEYLKNLARTTFSESYYLADQVYALYVLALAGNPDRSTMIYMKNNRLSELSLASRMHLAGAFGFSGDTEAATALMPVNIQPQTVPRETGGHFDSSVRTNAIILDILSEFAPNNTSIPVLTKWLVQSADAGRWYTTQENAFAFLALGKVMKRKKDDNFKGRILMNGEPYEAFGMDSKVLEAADLGGKHLEMSIEGKGTCYYYWQASGLPAEDNIELFDKGIKIRRSFVDRNGEALNYQNIQQGDLIVAEIKMSALDQKLENVIIADLLPAGFEIENPRLESRADVPWIKKQSFDPDYMDIRDDRLLLFVSLPERSERTFYYALRAVTAGEFILPPIKAEAMYDPVYTSISSSGLIKIK